MAEKQQLEKAQTWSFSMEINMDCEGCRKKVHKALQKMQGLQEVNIDASQNQVSVKGTVEPGNVMKMLARKTGKHVQLWKEEEELNQIENQECEKENDEPNKENTTATEQYEYNYSSSPFTWEEASGDENKYESSFIYNSESFLQYEEPESTPLCNIM